MDLTRFPSLFSHELKPENAQWVEKHLRGLRFSEEVISRAWASLLVAITGHHEVFFAVDESFVKVNSPSFNITKVDPAKQKHKRSEESTGVFLRSQDVPLHSALALIYNVDSESVILKSFGHVPLQYMEHIETYLKVAVDWFQGQEHSPVPLSWLSMLPKSISNEIPKAFPGDQLLHDIIASQGNHCAIDFRSTNGERIKLSFQEVNDRSTQLASSIFLQLGSRASCEQPIIAIYLPQSPELYISQIAILKVGCAFCCVNLDTPQDRLKFILNDIRAEILLTVPQYVEYISTIDIKCLLVDEPPALTSVMDTFHRVFEVSPKDTAYVMYTSGSTGLPKGVPVPHGAVTQSLLAHDEHMPPFSRFLQFAAPTFDVSIFEIYFTLYRGKTLVCCERMALLNDLVEIMNECDVDAAELTPTVAASLLRRRDAVPKLNLLLTIGEMLTTPVVHAFGGNEQQKSLLWAMYGPTEAAIHCTIQPALRSSSKVGIIGRPLRTASAFIISHPEYYDSSESAFEVLPEGFVGELAIGGFQLAGGYLNRPDQTASVFIDDSPWGRVYRTGDKARMLPDGSFECLGRISSGQVKLRGQRVELGEIEQTALRVRGCSNAVASIIENMLILFCSVDQGRLSEQIMTECERWLPSHMVPNDIVILHEFPHLASGKVDKNQLKENYQRTLNYDLSNENNLADETTSNIYKALQDVLGRSFPPSSQLTSVGVDSLIAIKLASQLRGMNYQIQPIDILRSNHLSDLRNLALQPNQADKAKSMEAEMAKIQDNSPYLQNLARSNSLLVSQWLDVDKIVKCSTTQIGMLTETAIDPLAYCNWIEIRVPTGINEPALKAYLRQIVANHDILRSGFVQTNSPGHEYLQIIWKTGQESDFLSVKDIEKKGFVMEDTSFMSRPIRFQLQLTENQDNRVLIQLHHALYDGWSMDLLIRDLELLFNGGTLMSCEQFQRVQNYYEHYDMEESLANWQDYLVQCSPTLLPSFDQDNNAPSNEPSSIHRFSCKMADLRNGASKLQITPQCYFQAAIIYLIGRIIGSPDIIIGTVTSGRMIPVEGIEEIFGPCMRTLPLRINLSYSKYGIDLLRNIHLLNRRLAEHSAVSMKDVKRSCGVDPGVPLSDALFIWQESLQSRYDNSTAFEIIDSSNNVEFKLIVEIEPRGDDLIGKISSRGWNPPFPLQYLLTKVDEIVVRLLQNSGTVLDHFLDVIPQFSRQIFEDQTPSIVVQDSQTEDEKWAAGEHIIRTCISDITGVPESKIQKHVSMFRYGVDSMSAIHLARLLRQRGFTSTSVSMILKHSTVSRLARAISIAKESQDSVASDKIDLLPSQLIRDIKAMFIEKGLQLEKVLPCTPLQEVMLSSHYSSDWNAYCNLMVFKIVGNPLKLMASFDAVIKRHEIFRTVFIQSDNSTFPFVQAVLPNNIDLWDTEAADHEYSEFDLRSNMLQAGRHLARLIDNMAPPISLRKVPNGEAVYLELICHHAVYDAYAMQLLIHDVECHYQQKELMLPPSSERFLQYSQSVQSRDSENFWLNTLKGFQPIVFHYTQSVNINVCSRPLIISLENLEMSCREQSTTLMVVLQATLAKLLAHVLHSEDVCFGNVVSGRTNSIDSLDRLVFPTFNTVPLRIKFSQFSNNTSLLTFIQNFSITSEPFNLFPLRKIQNGLELGGDALFSAILLLQQGIYELNSSIWELAMDSGNMDVPIIFELIPHRRDNQIILNLHYYQTIFDNEEIDGIINLFQHLIESCIRYPASSPLDIKPEAHSFWPIEPSRFKKIAGRERNSGSVVSSNNLSFSPTETTIRDLLGLFCNVPRERITRDTTIYHLGIDSISAIQFASRLSAHTKKRFLAADILGNPKVSDLESLLQGSIEKQTRPDLEYDFTSFEDMYMNALSKELYLDVEMVESVRPCTPVQTGLIAQFIQSGSTYVNFISYSLDGKFDLENLRSALITVANHHSALRCGFAAVDHAKHSYAMIIYKSVASDIVKTINGDIKSSGIDITQWRGDSTMEFHKKLYFPPWRALLIHSSTGIEMHLALFHAIYDAQSLQVLLHDLSSVYRGEALPQAIAVDPVIGNILSSGNSKGEEDFWRSQLGEGIVGEQLTNKFPDLTVTRTHFTLKEVYERPCSAPMKELESFCKAGGITLQAAGQAAWTRLLSSYLSESVVTYGLVLSGRDALPGYENVMFPCIVTVPVTTRSIPNTSRLLRNIMDFNSQVRPYQFSSLRNITRWSGRSNETLFDTIFSFQRFPGTKLALDWQLKDEYATDEYTLAIELEPSLSGSLTLRLTFNGNRLPNAQARIMADQLDFILCSIVKFPNHQWPLTMPESLLSIIPRRVNELPTPVTLLHQFVELNAKMIPHSPALEYVASIESGKLKKRVWSYEQLNLEGSKIEQFLQSEGIRANNLVGICFEKCPEASFAILGILKAGCGYVALDPGAPPARKQYIIRDSGCQIVLTAQRSEGWLSGVGGKDDIHPVRIVYVDELHVKLEDGLKTPSPVLPTDLCYCLYTSGTTGNPKGCEITHENAVQAMRAFSIQFNKRWNPTSKWLQFASFHFDVSILEQFWSWSEGICVVSAPRDLMLLDLPGFIRKLEITHLDLTPSLATLLKPEEVPSLCKGVFITGGEALRQDILNAWGRMEVIHNGYGPTEATIGVTMYPRVPANGKPSNIGKQFDNVGAYVLEPGTEIPVLKGAIGELCVSGKLVGRGYLNNAQLSSHKFPTLISFKERVYRTGDLVRLLCDGSFEFLGRSDDQVKLRGQRLEIGEIDSVIKDVTGVSGVSTFILRHPKQQKKQLVAFFTLESTPNAKELSVISTNEHLQKISQISENCKSRLPPYMVPTYFIPVSVLPLTANNKVDRNKLRRLYDSFSINELHNLIAQRASAEGLNTFEENVAHTLSRSLKMEVGSISPNSSLFELGLDSISVIRFVRVLHQSGFKGASISLVMNNSTIRSLSRALKSDDANLNDSVNVLGAKQRIYAVALKHKITIAKILNTDPVNIENSIYPCTPLQEGMIAEWINRQISSYFVTFKLVLTKNVDIVKLLNAWTAAYQSLDILRVQFVQTDDGFLQVCQRNQNLPWQEEYIGIDKEDYHRAIFEFRSSWIRNNQEHLLQPISFLLLRSAKFNYLILNIFHGLYDGNSFPLLLDQVKRIYYQESLEKAPQFASILAYGPLSSNQNARNFWKTRLNTTWATLPQKFQDNVSSSVSCSASLPCGGELETLRRAVNVTHQAIVQTCWSTVLQKCYTGRICMGLITSGRAIDYEGADKVIGPLFNTLLFQPELKPQDTWADMIRKTHDFNIAALPFQHTPLRDVLKWLAETDKQVQPLSNIFTFQITTEAENEAIDNDLWHLQDETQEPFFPLAFEAELHSYGSLAVRLVADSIYLDQNTLNKLLEEFIQLMSEMLENSQAIPSISEQSSMDLPSSKSSSERDSLVKTKQFEWTEPANIIRTEIARLASLNTSEITEKLSIFELGLDSIDVIKLSSRLSHLGVNIKVSAIIQNPSVAEMVEILGSRTMESIEDKRNSLKEYELQLNKDVQIPQSLKENVERLVPATPLQEAMYSEMITSSFQRYYNHEVLKLGHHIDTTGLTEAWRAVVKANPILRTVFVSVDDPSVDFTFVQAILRFSSINWNIRNIEGIDMIPQLIDEITAEAKNDQKAILPRFTLAQTGSERYLIFSIPHALYDGVSIQMVHEDVRKAYEGLKLQHPSYDSTLEDILMGSGPAAAFFWKSYLSLTPTCNLRESFSLSRVEAVIVHRKEFTSRITLAHIQRFCKSESVTLHHLTQTCYSLLLAAYTSTLEVVYALVLSGRNTEESQNVVFPTMNTVAFRSIIHGSYRDMLRQTQYDISNILLHLHFPLRKALSFIQRQHQKLFNSMFLFQARRNPEENTLSALYESISGYSDVEFDLCVEAEVVNNSLVWRNACRSSLMNGEETQLLLTRLDDILYSIMSNVTSESFGFDGKVIRISNLPTFVLETARDESETKISINDNLNFFEINEERQHTIRSVLSKVSKVPETAILPSSSLFQLGLDSISAIKVASILLKQGIRISVSSMMREPTLSAIAHNATETTIGRNDLAADLNTSHLSQLLSDRVQEKLRLIGLHDSDVENFCPASAGQEYFLAAWQQSEGTLFYPTFIYRSRGALSQESIRSAWWQLVEQNVILRTVFISLEEPEFLYLQVRLKSSPETLYFDDDKPETTHLTQPFVNIHAHKTSQGDWEFRLTIHHALYDGVSLTSLIKEFSTMLNNISNINETQVDTDFDRALWSLQSPEKSRSSAHFWKTYLADLSTPTLSPTVQPVSTTTRPRFEIFTPNFLPTVTTLLTSARNTGVSPQALILAAYAKAYAQHHSSTSNTHKNDNNDNNKDDDDVLIGMYLANRATIASTSSSTPTVNIVPLRIFSSSAATPSSSSISIAAATSRIQTDLAELGSGDGLERVGVPLGRVERWTGARVGTVFNFLSLPGAELEDEREEKEEGEGEGRRDGNGAVVVVREVRDEVEMARAIEVLPPSGEFVVPEEVRSAMSLEAYSPTLDIEIAIRDGALDVGLFGPTALMSLEKAKQFLNDFRSMIYEYLEM